MAVTTTVWLLGDQLDRTRGALGPYEPGEWRVLLVETEALVASKRWHRQQLHLVLSAMVHFADFADWADGRRQLKLEDFYRWHPAHFGVREPRAMGSAEQLGLIVSRWLVSPDRLQLSVSLR